MKKTLMSLLAGFALALVVALPAMAQNYTYLTNAENFKVRAGTITSASTITYDTVGSTSGDHALVLTGTTTTGCVVKFALKDGTVVSSTTVSATTTPLVIKTEGPLLYQKFSVSPTTALSGTNSVTVDSISTK